MTLSPTLAITRRRRLFSGSFLSGGSFREYDVAPDDQHFVMISGGAAQSTLIGVRTCSSVCATSDGSRGERPRTGHFFEGAVLDDQGSSVSGLDKRVLDSLAGGSRSAWGHTRIRSLPALLRNIPLPVAAERAPTSPRRCVHDLRDARRRP